MRSQVICARHAVTLALLLLVPATGPAGTGPEPSERESRVALQGQTLSATYVLKAKGRMEIESLQISKLIFDLARKYPGASAMTLKVQVDVTDADEQYSVREQGVVDLDQLSVGDLARIRKFSSYQSLQYGEYFWLPSKLQSGLDRLLRASVR